ncbi:MAG: MgtC/SapB family protein [Sphingomonas oligoaromativorans]|jgi:uncharacterized membrane protein (DUF4010 family)
MLLSNLIPLPFAALAAALGSGLLIGLDRGWRQRKQPSGTRVAGFRTFGLLGLAGGITGLFPDIPAAAGTLATGAIIALGYRHSLNAGERSATSAVAALATFFAGIACARLGPVVGLCTAGAAFVILGARQTMHRLLNGLSETEIAGAARFALVAFVILPLLPDQEMGPYGAWNPRRIWLVVVFVIGLSFAGYVAARRIGSSRGVLIMALTGAMVSSTAVTLDLAQRLRASPGAGRILGAGIALASAVMIVRIQFLSLVLVPRAASTLAIGLAPASLIAVGFAALAWRKQSKQNIRLEISNPAGFRPAIILACVIATLSLITRWLLPRVGGAETAIILGLVGMSDVDAAVMVMAGIPSHAIDGHTAGLALTVPALANTIVKAIMTIVVAPGRPGWIAACPLFVACTASAGTILVIW